MNRRRFLQQLGGLSSALFLNRSKSFAQKTTAEPIKLSIIYTGNMLGQIGPIQNPDDKREGLGGLIAQAKIIDQIKRESEHCLLINTGNLWQTNPPLTDEIAHTTISAMNTMGYSACGLGEQEINTIVHNNTHLFNAAKFAFLSCNIPAEIPTSKCRIQAYTTVQYSSIKVGIIGLNKSNNHEATKDAQANAIKLITYCDNIAMQLKNKEKCQLVICISQLAQELKDHPYENNYQLAKNSSNIDLIIGGNCQHQTFKPLKMTNKKKKVVLLTQLSKETIHLGRIDYAFYTKKTFFTTNAQTVELLK